MASRGCGRRGRPRENSQPLLVFDPQAFIEAIGAAVAIIVQASVVVAIVKPEKIQIFLRNGKMVILIKN